MAHTHKMTALPAQYDTAQIEKKWQDFWLKNKTYAWDANVAREDSYVIDTPPPTVSGTLHMGHVFSYTQADFIARFQRMNGKNVFYPMGFDDNGLPTERLVEKTKKIRAVDMSREAFIAECMSVSDEARQEFRNLFQSIALSVDWDQEYHTISDSSRRLSQLSFLDLVNKGHCYRAQRPFYWDPVDQTAIASAEIEDKELPSFANDIIFTAEGEPLTIMTTRPELLPACVALFCHPEDTRYTHLIGKQATVPLFGFSVPILADDTVEPEKGTGLMMCCTFGDDADIVKWQKHKLPTRVVLNKFGKMEFTWFREQPGNPDKTLISKNLKDIPADFEIVKVDPSNGFYEYDQLDAQYSDNFASAKKAFLAIADKKVSNADVKHPGARQITIELLKEAGVLVSQKPITHAVKCAERSGAPLEILPTHQWFVKVADKKAELTARAKECNWNPEWMRLRIEQWIEGLNQDWCISRQRYFGVPFPVWYSKRAGEEGKAIYASADQLPVNPLTDLPLGYTREEVIADADVMDTWATSSISPQLSAGAISDSVIPAEAGIHLLQGTNSKQVDSSLRWNDAARERFAKLFPADLRPQAHEIIRTWAFYTLVKAHLHNSQIPWENLMISGWCLAEDKSKMSKSKGNVVTPVALIEERGTDAVRYWAATSRLGTDTAFSPDLLKIGKKLVGKLWNATAFAAIHLAKLEATPLSAKADMESGRVSEVLDQWILSRLGQTVKAATDAFARYEYADALDATNNFFWADFCDNYLELIKKRVYNEDGSASAAAQQSAVVTLYHCLDGILKLYAPFCPHVTEELYAHIFADAYEAKGSLHAMGQWPKVEAYKVEEAALAAGAAALALLDQIRKAKSESNRSIKFPIDALTIPAGLSGAEGWMNDVAGAGNVRGWKQGEAFALTFAAEADAA